MSEQTSVGTPTTDDTKPGQDGNSLDRAGTSEPHVSSTAEIARPAADTKSDSELPADGEGSEP